MRRIIFLLTFLLLAVNGLLAWQNWKTERPALKKCNGHTCHRLEKSKGSGGLMLPGAWVHFS